MPNQDRIVQTLKLIVVDLVWEGLNSQLKVIAKLLNQLDLVLAQFSHRQSELIDQLLDDQLVLAVVHHLASGVGSTAVVDVRHLTDEATVPERAIVGRPQAGWLRAFGHQRQDLRASLQTWRGENV